MAKVSKFKRKSIKSVSTSSMAQTQIFASTLANIHLCHNYWAIFGCDNLSYALTGVIYPFPIYKIDNLPGYAAPIYVSLDLRFPPILKQQSLRFPGN